MSHQSITRQQIEIASEVMRRRERVRQAANEPPELRDVFVFRQVEAAVEWVVVECRWDDCLLVVPVDDYPMVGSCDVALDLGGVANVRCAPDLSAWLEASEFASELRTDKLSAKELERVSRKRRDIRDGSLAVSIQENEVDGDPEYQCWRDETLRRALTTLQARRCFGLRPSLRQLGLSTNWPAGDEVW